MPLLSKDNFCRPDNYMQAPYNRFTTRHKRLRISYMGNVWDSLGSVSQAFAIYTYNTHKLLWNAVQWFSSDFPPCLSLALIRCVYFICSHVITCVCVSVRIRFTFACAHSFEPYIHIFCVSRTSIVHAYASSLYICMCECERERSASACSEHKRRRVRRVCETNAQTHTYTH